MFNLIKYESLKLKTKASVFGILVVLFQIYFLSSYFTKDEAFTQGVLGKMAIFSFVFIVIYMFSAVLSLSKDINSQDRSMVFMTPHSGLKIVLSKYLTIIGVGFILLVTICFWLFLNLVLSGLFSNLTISWGLDSNEVSGFLLILVSICNFFALALLSIIITKTYFSRLKFKTLIIVIIMAILSRIFNFLFIDRIQNVSYMTNYLYIIIIILVTAIMIFISGWLVENKTDF